MTGPIITDISGLAELVFGMASHIKVDIWELMVVICSLARPTMADIIDPIVDVFRMVARSWPTLGSSWVSPSVLLARASLTSWRQCSLNQGDVMAQLTSSHQHFRVAGRLQNTMAERASEPPGRSPPGLTSTAVTHSHLGFQACAVG